MVDVLIVTVVFFNCPRNSYLHSAFFYYEQGGLVCFVKGDNTALNSRVELESCDLSNLPCKNLSGGYIY